MWSTVSHASHRGATALKIVPDDVESQHTRKEETPSHTISDGQPRHSIEMPFLSLLAVNTVISLFLVMEIAVVAQAHRNPSNHVHVMYSCLVVKLVLFIYGWGLFFVRTLGPDCLRRSNFVEHIFAVLICASGGVILTLRESLGDCDSGARFERSYCNILKDDYFLPPTLVVMLCLFPLGLEMIIPTLPWYVSAACVLTCGGFLIGNAIVYDAWRSYPSIGWSIVFNIISLLTYKYNRASSASNLNAYADIHILQVAMGAPESDIKRLSTHGHKTSLNRVDPWSSLLAAISRDLQPPLAIISNGCDLLASSLYQLLAIARTRPDHRELSMELLSAQHSLDSISNTNAYFAMMLHRYMDYCKDSQGSPLVPFFEVIHWEQCLHRAITSVQSLQPHSQLHYLSSPEDLGPLIATDQQWFCENILCLLANAVKQCSSLEGVAVHVHRAEDMIRFEVLDDGPPLPYHIQAILFEEACCQQPSPWGELGLGLYTLAKRCDALHGQYGYLPQHGGNLFFMAIPYDPPKGCNDWLSQEQLLTFADDGPRPRVGFRVLLVEAQEEVSKMTSRLLVREGHVVQTASSNQAAYRLWKAEVHDAIIMDVQPEDLEVIRLIRSEEAERRKWERACSGSLRCTGQVQVRGKEEDDDLEAGDGRGRQEEVHPRLVILACSEVGHEEIQQAAIAAGADALLAKPFQLQRFNECMDSFLTPQPRWWMAK